MNDNPPAAEAAHPDALQSDHQAAYQAAYQADRQPCTREAFYVLACDPQRSVVVEACAGAGKTWLLVSRIVRALLDGAAPHEILAITFTRKAAGEMRERLHSWLAGFAQADEATRVQELVLRGVPAARAPALAPGLALLHEQVLAAGRPVAISTFHAWFSQLLRAAPHELLDRLGLQPGMDLLEDASELRPALMRRFQAAVLADVALQADYTLLLERHGRSRLADWLATVLERRVELDMADEAGQLEDSVPAAADWWAECRSLADPVQRWLSDAGLRQLMTEAARAWGGHKNKKPRDAADGLVGALLAPDAQAGFDLAWDALFTGSGGARKLGELPLLDEVIDTLQRLADQCAQQQAHEDHAAMVRLARVLFAEWRSLKRQRGLADMNDLERCALLLLSDPVASGWVQQRLDARIRHLLIDEFQDTSPLQWHALYAWLAGYAGAGSGPVAAPAVFIVGDPKQSIYRFRRAEPRVFGAARDFVQQALGGVVLACDHTRRNSPGVIDVLNQVFEAAQDEGEMAGYRPHTTEVTPRPQPALRCLPRVPRPAKAARAKASADWRDSLTQPREEAEARLREREAALVADAIAALLLQEGVPAGEVMVLARKRQTLADVAQALRQRDIPCAAAESMALASLPEAADVIALLDALASPGHDLSLAQALKSPIFGASDAQLLALSQRAAEGRRAWWLALQAWADAPPPLERARQQLADWAEAARGLPPHDLLDRVVHQGDLMARLVAAAAPDRRALARHAVQALLAQALAIDGGRYVSLYGFVRALHNRPVLVPAPVAAGSVRLLTVHGAKGLEADVVFLVDCDPQRNQTSRPTVLVDWPVDATRPNTVALLASASRCPPALRELADAEHRLGEREAMNLLYVAMTRARRALVASATEPHLAAPGRPWWQRLQPLALAWSPPATACGAGADRPPPRVPVLPELPPEWRPLPQPATSARDEAAARLGLAVHRWLEWETADSHAATTLAMREVPLPTQAADRVAPHGLALAQAAATEFGLPADQADRVLQIAQRVRHSPELARFFEPTGLVWAGNEVPVAAEGQALRIDRLVQLRGPDGQAGPWWVLDYKLHHAPEQLAENLEQLARYRRLVALQVKGQTVHAGFITADGRLVPLATA